MRFTDIFQSFELQNYLYLVFSHLSFVFSNFSQPFGHAVAHFLQILLRDVKNLHSLDLVNEDDGRSDLLLFEHVFHKIPKVFYWIEVKRVAWPFHNLNVGLLQVQLHLLGGVAGGPVLEEVRSLVPPHERLQMMLQAVKIAVRIYSNILRKEE